MLQMRRCVESPIENQCIQLSDTSNTTPASSYHQSALAVTRMSSLFLIVIRALIDHDRHAPHDIGETMTTLRSMISFQIIHILRASSVGVAIQFRINPLGTRRAPIYIGPDSQHIVVTYIVVQAVRLHLARVLSVVKHFLIAESSISFATGFGVQGNCDAGVFTVAGVF